MKTAIHGTNTSANIVTQDQGLLLTKPPAVESGYYLSTVGGLDIVDIMSVLLDLTYSQPQDAISSSPRRIW